MNHNRLTVPLEIKTLTKGEFEGYGSVFGNEDLGGDIVAHGAFTKSLNEHQRKGSMPMMFWMHDPTRVPGKWLEMSEDQHGLHVKGVLADTPLGNEMQTLLKMEAVRGLSIGFSINDQEWKDDLRIIKEAKLWETSIVSLPMNPLANVAHAKSQLSVDGEYVPTAKEFERILRDAGCSRTVAKTIISKMREDEERDAPDPQDEGPRDAAAILRSMNESFELRAIQTILGRQ